MTYSEWSKELAEYFLGRHLGGQRVRLVVTERVLDEYFPLLGGYRGFLEAVVLGPDWTEQYSLEYSARFIHEEWKGTRARNDGYPEIIDDAPPYLPYLCLFCLAWTAEVEDEVNHNAYYDRLTPLYPGHGIDSHAMRELCCLWESLEWWTHEKREGKNGYWKLERLGMPYVGIPKSQVIFPPHKIDRLPDLFGRAHLEAGSDIEVDELRKILLAVSTDTQVKSILGCQVIERIKAYDDFGDSALKILLAHFEDWDGSKHDCRKGDAVAGKQVVRIVLKSINDHTGWECYYGILDNPCDGASSRNPEVMLIQEEASQLSLIGRDGQTLPVQELDPVLDRGSSFTLNFLYREDLSGDSHFGVRYAGEKDVRTFGSWQGNYIVESDSLPEDGGCYLLLTGAGKGLFQTWRQRYGQALLEVAIPQSGLLEGHFLVYIDQLQILDDEARKKFPASITSKRAHKRAKLVSGSRIRTGAARKAYLHYDLPQLNCESSLEPQVSSGEVAFELLGSPVSGLPGMSMWEYGITLLNEPSVVVINVIVDGKEEVLSFGVFRDNQAIWETIPAGDYRVNKFGRPAKIDGLRGYDIQRGEQGEDKLPDQFQFHEAKSNISSPAQGVPPDGMGQEFIEAVFLEATRLIPIQEVCRKAKAIAQLDAAQFYRELRWLRDLGYIEIKTDQKGRWSHCINNPPALCLLPITDQGYYQAVLSGCMKRSMVETVCWEARTQGFQVISDHKGRRIIPPRVTLKHQQLAKFSNFSRQLDLWWDESPPAIELAKWAGSMDEWLEDVGGPWLEGAGPVADGGYVPEKLRSEQGVAFHAPFRLDNVEDTITGHHRWFKVVRTNSIHEENTGEKRHAFIRDPSWAKWKSHSQSSGHLNGMTDEQVPDEESLLVQFDEESMTLSLPREMSLPYVLSRALTMCNGRAPDEAWTDQGLVFRYSPVPRALAVQILEKVMAKPD